MAETAREPGGDTVPRAAGHLAGVDTLFLDAGNTLVSMDPEILASALSRLGIHAPPATIDRAEAAARPRLSQWIAAGRSSEAGGTRHRHLRGLIAGLLAAAEVRVDARSGVAPGTADGRALDELARALLGQLYASVAWDRLWSRVLPGIPAALAALRAAGLGLAVVSNSDGSVERKLRAVGLRDLVDLVVDSAVERVEKPDPAIFALALDRMHADPARTVHVGDLHAVDVVGARRAGLRAVLLDPFGDWGEVDCPVHPDVPSLGNALIAARPPPDQNRPERRKPQATNG